MAIGLKVAAVLDRVESAVRRRAEPFGFTPWLKEFKAYRNDPRMELGEFWGRYASIRERESAHLKSIETEAAAVWFYQHSAYMLWRNLVHRRHSAWRRVLWTMHRRRGWLLEYGCGTAPVSSWCAPRKLGWTYCLADHDGPARRFAYTRIAPATATLRDPNSRNGWYEVITVLDTFEHLPDPLHVAKNCVDSLYSGGYLHWNFVETDGTGLNRATEFARYQTLAFLAKSTTLIYDSPEHRISRKP